MDQLLEPSKRNDKLLNQVNDLNKNCTLKRHSQGSRLTVANWPQTRKNSILASGFCALLAILASENF